MEEEKREGKQGDVRISVDNKFWGGGWGGGCYMDSRGAVVTIH